MLPKYYIPTDFSSIDWDTVTIGWLEKQVQKIEEKPQETINEKYGTSYNSQPINLSKLRPRNIPTTHYGNKL